MNEDGSTTPVPGRLELFRNADEYGNLYGRPRTLLIDSQQLESGDELDDSFHQMAAPESSVARLRGEFGWVHPLPTRPIRNY